MSIVNSTLYPLSDPARRAEIAAQAAAQLAADGAAAFPDFIDRDVLDAMVTEAKAKFDLSHRRDMRLGFNPQGKLAEIADDELRERSSRYSMWLLGSDHLAPEGELQTFYRSPELLRFVEEILGIESLHVTDDPLVNVNVTYLGEDDSHGWHFDDNEFVVSLLLQKPEEGGAFEYVPEADEVSIEEAHAIIDESSPLTKFQQVEAGTLLLFRGKRALHRVSPVVGDRHRIIALLSYHTAPGFIYSDGVKQNSLGRIEPIAA